MPETEVMPSDRLTAAALAWARRQVGQPFDARAIDYAPTVTYRGRVLWHHLSDAHTVATELARSLNRRYRVQPQRVPGWGHLLWRIRPCQ